MHAISVRPKPTMKVNIRNQCSDFKLTFRGYFGESEDLNENPADEVDVDSMTSVDLTPFRAALEGALMYELERKHVKTGNQPELGDIILLIAWKSGSYKNFCVFMHLVECNEWSSWYEATPEEYYQRYANQLLIYTGPIKDTWLIPNGTILMTELELDFTQRDGVLNITISKGAENTHTKRPELIDLER
jgi:hypothetical protein